jgi:hypothetical protein
MKYTKYISLLLVLMLFGCSAAGTSESISNQAGIAAETTDQGTLLSISSDKAIYHPGETVRITASAANLTDAQIEYTLMNLEDPQIYIYLEETPFSGGQSLLEEDYKFQAVHPMVTSEVLEAKQLITRKVIWDQQLPTHPDPIQAPSGIYRISCTFIVGPYSTVKEPTGLSTGIEIQIEGAGNVISPEKALEIARAVPEVAAWVVQHSGSNVFKYENGDYYTNLYNTWEKVAPGFIWNGMTMEEMQKSYEPDHNVMMVGNVWEVGFFTKLGEPPNEIWVKIDSTTGKVFSTETGK